MTKRNEEIEKVNRVMVEREADCKKARDETGSWKQIIQGVFASGISGIFGSVLYAGHISLIVMVVAFALSFLSIFKGIVVSVFVIIAIIAMKRQNYFHVNSLHSTEIKLRETRTAFEQKRLQLEKCKEKELNDTITLFEIAKDMADLQTREKTAEDTVKIARNALVALGKARNHWTEMMMYFMNIRNIITLLMERPLDQFMEDSQRIIDAGQMSPRLQRRLQQCVDESDQIIRIVLVFSNNYSKVSRDFIMPMASRFGEMIALYDKDEIRKTQTEVFKSAVSMQKEIEQMVKKSRNQLEVKE